MADDYLPSEEKGRRRKGQATTEIGPTTNRIRLGTGMAGHSSTSRLRRVVDPFEDDSSSQVPAVDAERPSTSRIKASLDTVSHICQPCRNMFLAQRRIPVGVVLELIAVGLYIWYLSSPLFIGMFWGLVMHAAVIIFIIIGIRNFYLFTNCPACGSARTSRLDTPHGRQIQTETIVKSETSYIRKSI